MTALVSIAATQAGLGDCSIALQTVEQIEEPWRKAEALCAIAAAYAKRGDIAAAQSVCSVAVQTAQQSNDDPNVGIVLSTIAIAQAQTGDFVAALQTAQQIEVEGGYRGVALGGIAVSQAEASDFSEAVRTAQQIHDSAQRADVLVELASIQTFAGETEAARDVFSIALDAAQPSEDGAIWAEVLAEIGTVEAASGYTAKARLTFSAATHLAEHTHTHRSRARALRAIYIAQKQSGDAEGARATFALMPWGSYYYGNPYEDRPAGLDRAISQVENNRFSAALRIARQIRNAGDRVDALCAIGVALAKVDHEKAASVFLDALQMAQEAENPSAMLSRIAASQAKAGLRAQAIQTAERIVSARDENLPEVAAAFVEARDIVGFKTLLLECVFYLSAACRMCGILAKIYPEQATKVAEVVLEHPAGARPLLVPGTERLTGDVWLDGPCPNF